MADSTSLAANTEESDVEQLGVVMPLPRPHRAGHDWEFLTVDTSVALDQNPCALVNSPKKLVDPLIHQESGS